MDVTKALEILLSLLMMVLTVRTFFHLGRRKPFFSVNNARALLFAGGMFVVMIYFWVGLFKPFLL
jgi:hypothetical protein